MISEVLSESTQLYDRGQKFKLYHSIPTLNTGYFPRLNRVEHYIKQAEDAWNFRELSIPEVR